MNFSTFYTQAIKEKIRKRKRGKYKGLRGNFPNDNKLDTPGMPYTKQPMQPGGADINAYTMKG